MPLPFQAQHKRCGREYIHHESFSDVVVGGAVAIVRALSDSKKEATEIPQRNGTLVPGISPSKAVDLQMKNFEELRYVQLLQLYEDGILNEKEYMEQMNNILAALRNIDL